jgi:hypothetical protein
MEKGCFAITSNCRCRFRAIHNDKTLSTSTSAQQKESEEKIMMNLLFIIDSKESERGGGEMFSFLPDRKSHDKRY